MAKRSSKRLDSDKVIKPKFIDERLQDLPPLKPLNPLQAKYIEYIDTKKLVIATGLPGTSKAQPLYSKILTPDGWKTMGDMTVGSIVVTPKNTNSTVTEVHKFQDKPVYTITFASGRTVDACGDHLWNVRVAHKSIRGKSAPHKTIPTTEIMSLMENNNLSIPLCEEIGSVIDKDYYIPPYIMGILIAEGCFSNGVAFSSGDQEIVDIIDKWVNDHGLFLSSASGSIFEYYIRGDGNGGIARCNYKEQVLNPVNEEIIRLGLFKKKSYDKFIPDEYLEGSITQRWELLRGLMDGDGGVVDTQSRNSTGASFSSASEILIDQVQSLIFSLGGYAHKSARDSFYTYKGNRLQGRTAYKLYINHPTPKKLFKLSRKITYCGDQYQGGKYQLMDRIVDISYKEQNEVWCIKIDDEDHLYLTDNYIVTHNTYIPTVMACDKWRMGEIDRIYLTRPNISNSKSLGYFGGSLIEKMTNWLLPVLDIMYKRLGRNVVELAIKSGDISFIPLEIIKGMSFGLDTFVIGDEFEDATVQEILSVVTRQGGCTMVLCGDIEQSALNEKSGLLYLKNVVEKSPELEQYTGFVDFNRPSDIVRSQECKAWILALKHFKE